MPPISPGRAPELHDAIPMRARLELSRCTGDVGSHSVVQTAVPWPLHWWFQYFGSSAAGLETYGWDFAGWDCVRLFFFGGVGKWSRSICVCRASGTCCRFSAVAMGMGDGAWMRCVFGALLARLPPLCGSLECLLATAWTAPDIIHNDSWSSLHSSGSRRVCRTCSQPRAFILREVTSPNIRSHSSPSSEAAGSKPNVPLAPYPCPPIISTHLNPLPPRRCANSPSPSATPPPSRPWLPANCSYQAPRCDDVPASFVTLLILSV